jgi:hypothetical protein
MNETLRNRILNLLPTYSGHKLSMLVTGGGFGLAEIGMLPGVSALLSSLYSPYSVEESTMFVERHSGWPTAGRFKAKMVSKDASVILCEALAWKNLTLKVPSTINIALTASLTTSRYRKGKNEAFISILLPKDEEFIKTWHLSFPKLSEEAHGRLTVAEVCAIRAREEEVIALVALVLALNLEGIDLENEIGNAKLERLY